MRLLNTTTLKLHEFFGSDIPFYAILSHRWGIDDVTFQDLQQGRGPNMAGWSKIVGCCAQARKEGWDYAWIDSCCIDKSSSAELSEAINSMFQWYKNSQVCYAYLADVPVEEKDHMIGWSSFRFRTSQWFTRGWTLQELLAPETVIFFNRGWHEIGTRCTFQEKIASITGIHGQFLEGGFGKASIAQKFLWASKRETLRVEDTAYSLMGLFGVHMPLLYGEGSEAFTRLQLEIMKISDDDSLFVWRDSTHSSQRTGLLANTPAEFHDSGDVRAPLSRSRSAQPYSMTNKGLSISLMLIPAAEAWNKGVPVKEKNRSSFDSLFFAPLSCYTISTHSIEEKQAEKIHILLPLRRITQGDGYSWYTRPHSDQLYELPSTAIPWERKRKQIFVPELRYGHPVGDNALPRRKFSKVAINPKYFFSNGFAIFSVFDIGEISDSCPEDHRPRIERWLPPDNDAHECTVILPSGTKVGESMPFVAFKDLIGPPDCEDSFVLGIDHDLSSMRSIGIFLLLPNGKPLDELIREACKYKKYKPSDRATINLPSGRVVSAALRKRKMDYRLVYAVDFEVK